MSLKYIVPALAVAGRAVAADCSVSATTTIQNAGDASALASCTTFSGSIAIATGTTDNIDLTGIQVLDGSLIAENTTTTEISAGDMETITDTFGLNELTALTSLSFPRLTQVDTIDWVSLPNLQSLSFTTGVQEASSVSIQNTQLSSLDGINLEVVDTFYIANNPYLSQIQMQLGNVTNSLVIEANAQETGGSTNGTNVELTNLIWAYNMTFRNVSTVLIPSLTSLNGSMGFYGNSFETLTADNLTDIGGSLSFVGNGALSNISMPVLETIEGALLIADNPELEGVSFPELTTIGGAFEISGSFDEVSIPNLDRVAGAFTLDSTEDISDICSKFREITGSANAIRGKFTCNTGRSTDSSGSGSGSGSSSSSDSSDSSDSSNSSDSTGSSAANSVYISGTTGLLGVVAAIFGIL